MRVVKVSELPKEPFISRLFTGADVTRQPLVPESKDYSLAIVNFGKGVRNKFHVHESEQVLIVTAGKGIVATDQEEKAVAAGDVIFIPAGEKHWHGATGDSEFSHIALTLAASRTTQVED